jgi:acyl-coenzyme A thioesterase PaaI-like protein
MSVGETEFRSAGSGELVAISVGTFLASPRPADRVPTEFPGAGRPNGTEVRVAPSLAEQIDLQVIEPGVAEIALRPDLLNATDSLQGGLVALLGEIAAQTSASEAAGAPHVVDSLDVHYLAAARVGPFRATARTLSLDGGRPLVRVEARDPGRDNRVVSITIASTRPAPGS